MPKSALATPHILKQLGAVMEDVSCFTPLKEGDESQAFSFKSANQSYVLRVSQSATGFRKDRFVSEKFTTPTLPIPRIVTIERIDDHVYCISEKLPGTTLQELSPQHLEPVLGPTARALTAIGESRMETLSGFGSFDAEGAAHYRTWRDFLLGVADARQFDWASVDLPSAVINPLLDALYQLAASCPEERKLVHADFGSNNGSRTAKPLPACWTGRKLSSVIPCMT